MAVYATRTPRHVFAALSKTLPISNRACGTIGLRAALGCVPSFTQGTDTVADCDALPAGPLAWMVTVTVCGYVTFRVAVNVEPDAVKGTDTPSTRTAVTVPFVTVPEIWRWKPIVGGPPGLPTARVKLVTPDAPRLSVTVKATLYVPAVEY